LKFNLKNNWSLYANSFADLSEDKQAHHTVNRVMNTLPSWGIRWQDHTSARRKRHFGRFLQGHTLQGHQSFSWLRIYPLWIVQRLYMFHHCNTPKITNHDIWVNINITQKMYTKYNHKSGLLFMLCLLCAFVCMLHS
jgi:hypothetical protein